MLPILFLLAVSYVHCIELRGDLPLSKPIVPYLNPINDSIVLSVAKPKVIVEEALPKVTGILPRLKLHLSESKHVLKAKEMVESKTKDSKEVGLKSKQGKEAKEAKSKGKFHTFAKPKLAYKPKIKELIYNTKSKYYFQPKIRLGNLLMRTMQTLDRVKTLLKTTESQELQEEEDHIEAPVDDNFAPTDDNFAPVNDNFGQTLGDPESGRDTKTRDNDNDNNNALTVNGTNATIIYMPVNWNNNEDEKDIETPQVPIENLEWSR